MRFGAGCSVICCWKWQALKAARRLAVKAVDWLPANPELAHIEGIGRDLLPPAGAGARRQGGVARRCPALSRLPIKFQSQHPPPSAWQEQERGGKAAPKALPAPAANGKAAAFEDADVSGSDEDEEEVDEEDSEEGSDDEEMESDGEPQCWFGVIGRPCLARL